MIQLNLLPDVKLDYIKAQRTRSLFISISVLVSLISLGIVASVVTVGVLQKKHLSDLNGDITSMSSKLKNQPDINKVLTIQNQLSRLTSLHDTKPQASQLGVYLNQTLPVDVAITGLDVNFALHTASITGVSDKLSAVNQYVDTLKFVTYSTSKVKTETKAFSAVVLSAFAINTDEKQDKPPVTYTVTFTYDPAIFDITQTAKLTVPDKVTTRSQVEQPTELFTAAPVPVAKSKGDN